MDDGIERMASLLSQRVRERMRVPAPTVLAGTALADAARALAARDDTVLVVVAADGGVLGLIGARELACAALGVGLSTPVERVARAQPCEIAADAPIAVALARMQRDALDALAVVGAGGDCVGVLHRADLASSPAACLGFDDERGLVASKAAQPAHARALLAAGTCALDVQALLGEWNRALYRVAAELAAERSGLGADGSPAVDFDLLVMGSVGRGECQLGPDQDNAIVLDDAGDPGGALGPFAAQLSGILERAGFPLCRGGVMATSESWRRTLSEWVRQVVAWTRQGEGRPLRMCDIFFDFHCVHGAGRLAATLRERTAEAAAHPHFLRALYRVDEEHGVALDLLGRLRGDPLPGPHHGEVQLKLNGLLPLVGVVRILALRHRVFATGTRARLDALRDAAALGADEHEEMIDAFARISGALLARQCDDVLAGRAPAAHVPVTALGRLERIRIAEALAAVRRLRSAVRSELAGEPVLAIGPGGP